MIQRAFILGAGALIAWYLGRRVPRWWANFRAYSVPSPKLYAILSGLALSGLYRRIVEEVAPSRHEGSVLDIGCGPGALVVLIARRNPEMAVIGVDISAEMVALASRRAKEAGVADRVTLRVGDVAKLPFGDGQFDLVVSSLSRHHWPDAMQGLREILRVLNPGGEARIYDVADWFARIETRGPSLRDLASSGIFDEAVVEPYWRIGPIAVLYRLRLLKKQP